MAYDTLTLYSGVKLDPRFEHTIIWRSIADKLNYFESRISKVLPKFSYLRNGEPIIVPYHLEELENDINYCSTSSMGFTRYYFITKKEYVSEKATRLYIELDVLQTYQEKWDIPSCFVEREHVVDDIPGNHLVDEGLETGEMVVQNGKYLDDLTEMCIIVQSAVTLDNPMGEAVEGDIFAGVYSGYKLYTCSANDLGVLKLNAAIKALDTMGKTDGIISMWMYPKKMVHADWDAETESVMLPVLETVANWVTGTLSDNLDGYVPRNKKLLTHPYKFLYAFTMSGASAIYRYELFNSTTYRFELFGSLGADGVIRLVPSQYRGYAVDHESGLSLTGFPTCAWTQDAYKIWLAQNTHSQDLSIQSGQIALAAGGAQTVFGAGMSLGGLFTGGGDQMISSGINMMYSGYQQIAGVMAARNDKQVQPPQAKGVQSSSVNIAYRQHTFAIANMSIQKEYAERLDSFFDMYGYRVDTVKKPNYKSRLMWNYIKTIGCVVLGDIDSVDRQKIAAIFDKGVTCWHDPDIMYNYENAPGNMNVV